MSRSPRPSVTTLTLWLLAALLSASSAEAAEPHAIPARGFEPDQIYDFHSIDHVNLFNGNLVVTIPSGQRYPVHAGFEYGFTLVYNSHIWDYVIDCPADGIDEYGETDLPELFLTDPASASQACGGGSPPPKALRGIPNPKSNAGTGWRLSLGELYDVDSPLVPNRGWTFVGPDGAELLTARARVRRHLPPLHPEGDYEVPAVSEDRALPRKLAVKLRLEPASRLGRNPDSPGTR